jgi:hypothetical protein
LNITELKNLITAKTGNEPKPSGQGFICHCPAHDDKTASLSISAGRDGLLLNCHAGCTFEAVTAALGINPVELFHAPGAAKNGKPAKSGKFNIVANYPYHDAEEKLRFEVCRLDPKGFRQRRPDPAAPGKWIWNLKGVELIPYRLPELITAAKAGETVFVRKSHNGFSAWLPVTTSKARTAKNNVAGKAFGCLAQTRENHADMLMKPFLNFGCEKKVSEVSARTLRTPFSYSVPVKQDLAA